MAQSIYSGNSFSEYYLHEISDTSGFYEIHTEKSNSSEYFPWKVRLFQRMLRQIYDNIISGSNIEMPFLLSKCRTISRHMSHDLTALYL